MASTLFWRTKRDLKSSKSVSISAWGVKKEAKSLVSEHCCVIRLLLVKSFQLETSNGCRAWQPSDNS